MVAYVTNDVHQLPCCAVEGRMRGLIEVTAAGGVEQVEQRSADNERLLAGPGDESIGTVAKRVRNAFVGEIFNGSGG